MIHTKKLRRLRVGLASLFAVLLAIGSVGCASTPRPVAQLAAAEAAVQSAQSDEAGEFAPIAMDRAEEKLRRANDAMGQQNYALAKRLAEEALADAEFAQAATAKAQTEQSVKEMQIGIEMLREEIRRSQTN